ncbi:YihY/virulence factor BrkB family protein [Actinokineospora terrae]|uniref:Membrane protein n=1 Tax=Actinokineospora terrae TaxID=155974 RepID=A0A1H9MPX8_9PSEU|nr:YihY/virulence factor BrkB family protein [Actinokineospora terrae]SER25754.1 membrane protein [Actinokineospora terrae]
MTDEPEAPTDLPRRSWWAVLKNTAKEFQRDNLLDWAAALTYYGVLSLFPAIIVLTSVLALLSPSATAALVDNVRAIAPGETAKIIVDAIEELQRSNGAAGVLAVVGVAVALWSASGYVGAFMRASNSMYEMPEGRPVWKTIPLRLALTAAVVVLLAVSALGIVATGTIARRVGGAIGIGDTGVRIWDIAKWPVIALLVALAFALLYWAAPNVRQPGFRWLSPGGLLAVLVWALATGAFGLYVANFGSYNKTYGSLGGVIAFLVWLWISNIAVLLGAELDAELARAKEVAEGLPADVEPFLPPRDTRSLDDDERAEAVAGTRGESPR